MATKMTRGIFTSFTKGHAYYEFSETLTGAGNGEAFYCDEPFQLIHLSATLIPTAGSGYIQTTTSSIASVLANTANWITWTHGTISSSVGAVFSNVTAIRQVNVSGTTQIEGRLA